MTIAKPSRRGRFTSTMARTLEDGWFNTSTELGKRGVDVAADTAFAAETLPDATKARMYDRDWVTRKIVRMLPEHAFQDELVFGGDNAKEDAERWQNLNRLYGADADDGAVLSAACKARLFGGALLLKGYTSQGGSLEAPVSDEGAELEFLDVITSAECAVSENNLYNTPDDPKKHRLPEHYEVKSGRYQGAKIHETRVIPFYGPPRAPFEVSQLASGDRDTRFARWGNSIVDILQEEAGRYGITWASLSRLIQEASLVWFKMDGFFDLIKANDLATISARLSTLSIARGPHKTLVLNSTPGKDGASEEIGRLGVDFSGLDKVLHQLNMVFSAATDVPLNVFFGSVVGGLNASSDSDQKLWNGRGVAYRARTLRPRIEPLMKALGIENWDFRDLDAPSQKDRVESEFKQAQTRKTYFDLGALSTEALINMVAADNDLDPAELKTQIESDEQANAEKAAAMGLPSGADPDNPLPPEPEGPKGTKQNESE